MCLAIPGRIVAMAPAGDTSAIVEVVGVRRRIDVGLLQDDPPVPGDWVLIHVGFAMSKVSAEQAAEQMRMLATLGERDAAAEEAAGYGGPDAGDSSGRRT